MKKNYRAVLLFVTLTYISAAIMALIYWIYEMNEAVGYYGWDLETCGFSVLLTMALIGTVTMIYVWYNYIVLGRSIKIETVEK